jgi:hypothetical protein
VAYFNIRVNSKDESKAQLPVKVNVRTVNNDEKILFLPGIDPRSSSSYPVTLLTGMSRPIIYRTICIYLFMYLYMDAWKTKQKQIKQQLNINITVYDGLTHCIEIIFFVIYRAIQKDVYTFKNLFYKNY